MYTKEQFGKELEEKLKSNNYDIVQLSRWAFNKYNENTDLEVGLSEEIMKVVAMEEGSELEYTKDELQEFAINLQK